MDGPTYLPASAVGALRQGEILSSVEQHIVVIELDGAAPPELRKKTHPLAIVLSQDCDLEQDFKGRSGDAPLLRLLMPNILICEVDVATNLQGDPQRIAPGGDIWKRIIQNKDERYQYLREIRPGADAEGIGTAPLLIDFKRTFTLPSDGLYAQINRTAKRRTVLASPYREHLSWRHACFIARVALPLDHHV